MPTVVDRVTCNINKRGIINILGYDARTGAPLRISRAIDALAEENLNNLEPAYAYIIKDIICVAGDDIFIEGGVHLCSHKLAGMLRSSCKAAFFVLTIGESIERAAAELARNGSVLKAAILEAIGANAAENIAKLVEERIKYEVSNQGLYTGKRFSPGHCEWPVDQQEEIFKVFKGNSAGVQLTDGYLMLPRKSVSGIIGIGTRDSGVTEYTPCITCHKAVCPGRRG